MAKGKIKSPEFPILDLDARTDLDALETIVEGKGRIKSKIKKRIPEEFDLVKKLFSLFLLTYLRDDGKELYLSPNASRSAYNMNLIKRDGSKIKMLPPPIGIFEKLLKQVGSELGIMEYDPYSDREQTGTFNARVNGKDNLLELYVRQSKYGREIVVKRK